MKKIVNPVTVTLAFFVTVQLFSLLLLLFVGKKEEQRLATPKGESIVEDAQLVDIDITPEK